MFDHIDASVAPPKEYNEASHKKYCILQGNFSGIQSPLSRIFLIVYIL